MSERDDYLDDPAATPDPELAALEHALAPLRWREGPLRELPPDPRAPAPATAARRAPRPHPRWRAPLLAAAALLLGSVLAVGAWALWGGTPLAGKLAPGAPQQRFVAADAPLTIALGGLAEITLRPGSELEFVHWRADQALFALARGGLSARVAPPPAVAPDFFVIDTPLGRVVDKGCRFELDVAADGSAAVRVIEGRVTFTDRSGRVLFVPAGAHAAIGPRGPQTPCFDDAPPLLEGTLRKYDDVLAAGDALEVRAKLLDAVVAAATQPRDTLVLWHLLRDPEPALRELAEQRLIELVGSPAGKGGSADPEEWLPYLRLRAWQ